MDPHHDPKKLVEFNHLNPAGKVIFIAGTAFKIAERAMDFTISTLSTIWDEAERAFHNGLSDEEDAVILEETKTLRSPSNPTPAKGTDAD